jgi:hypothetical protein
MNSNISYDEFQNREIKRVVMYVDDGAHYMHDYTVKKYNRKKLTKKEKTLENNWWYIFHKKVKLTIYCETCKQKIYTKLYE